MFLPLIPLFLGLLWGASSPEPSWETAAPQQTTRPRQSEQEPAPRSTTHDDTARLPRVSVVAGTGDVDPADVERVRATVDAELPALVRLFEGRPEHPFFVFVHENRDALTPELATSLHADSPAFALLGRRQIHIVYGEMRRLGVSLPGVVRHELVHELLDQYVVPHGRRIPRWFHEGLAQYVAGDTYLRASEDDLVWQIGARRLPSFGELAESFPTESSALRTAYAQSFSYVSFLAETYGVPNLLRVARSADEYTTFLRALVGRTGRSTYELDEAWRHYVLHGSGAPWRVALDQCFTLSIVAVLPLLALALIRRLGREQRIRRHLAVVEANADAAVAAAAAAAAAAPPTPLDPNIGPDTLARDPDRAAADEGNPDNGIESRPPAG